MVTYCRLTCYDDHQCCQVSKLKIISKNWFSPTDGCKNKAWSGMSNQLIMTHLPTRMEMQKDIPQLHAQPQKYQVFEHCNFCWDPCSLFQFNWWTHRVQASLTLDSIFPFCTAKSINITVSAFSAAAVFSTRLPQWLPFRCISSKRTLTCDLDKWLTTHFLIGHIEHLHQGDSGSVLEIVPLPPQIHSCSGIYLGDPTHPTLHYAGTGRIW